jgi:micrococcal nuclease
MKLFLLLSLVAFCPVTVFAQNLENADQNQGESKQKCNRNQPIESSGVVVRAYDGDTVLVKTRSGNYSIRLIGIDTPETHFMGQSQGPWGEKAAQKLAELLPAKARVRLEFSPSPCDQYGRGLAHLFVGKVHINKELAQEGLAANYCIFPSVEYCEEIGQLTKQAMKQRIGMFSDPNVELPYDFRRRIKGARQSSFVGNLKTKKVYRPGNQEEVPVAERVFFFREEQIRAPYQIVD